MKRPVYLDNHATTRVDPRVLEAMLPYFGERYGNAASAQHEFGWVAESAVEVARTRVAELIGAVPSEIVFTSGATESINLALKGIAEGYGFRGNHIITAATEHRAVLDSCRRLEQAGYTVTYLPVDADGILAPERVSDAITSDTILVSVMLANNEIGTIAPLADIARVCQDRGVIVHTDATQAAGKIPIDVAGQPVDLLSLSAHKMYGPKGIGALYVRATRPTLRLTPQIDGGGHERGMRSGTLNVPAIVGFGEAARLARAEMAADERRISALRDRLERELRDQLGRVGVNGHPVHRLPNNASLTFEGTRADRVMMDMKDIAVSTGSACSSASPEPSHVLRAIGLRDDRVLATIRFGLGRFTTEEEISYTIGRVVETVRKARARVADRIHTDSQTLTGVQ